MLYVSACDPGAQDVGVVAVGHGGESSGLFDPRLREVVAVEPETHDSPAAEAGTQAPEGPAALVDDRDRVPAQLERAGQLAADTTASDDHDVHDRPPRPKRWWRMLRRRRQTE